MALLHYLSYMAILAAFAFITLSLASGLLYISELIEEHSRLAKAIGQRGIYVIILMHIMLYFSESLPLGHTLFSIACHIVYLQNFSATWPLISLTSISFLASCVFVVSDHFLWFFYFARITQEARHTSHRAYGKPVVQAPGFVEIATFFGVCVWLAPLFLFLSLSANDNALPVQTDASSPSPSHVPLLKSILRRKSSRREQEGILAPPRSPGLHPTPSPIGLRPTSPSLSHSTPPPPRSPGLGIYAANASGFADHLSPPTKFSLDTPPQRIALRRTSGDYSR